jgi:hypothetical protein
MSVTPNLDGSVQITAGTYSFNADCPECGARIVLPVELETRLTVTGSAGGKIRPFMSSKSVEHSCGQDAQPPMFEGNGAPAAPEMSEK